MRRTIVALGMFIALGFGATVEAKERLEEMAKVRPVDKKVQVYLAEGLGDVAIRVENLDGQRVFSTRMQVNEVTKLPLNLQNLPDGEYLVKIRSANQEIVERVELGKRPMNNFSFLSAKAVLETPFALVLDMVVENEEPLKVTVKDFEGREFDSEFVTRAGRFQKRVVTANQAKATDFYFEIKDSNGNVKNIYY
ncbi:MAG: T9SS type A sorting domain-containing protein [Nitritalea sp.]